MFYIGKYTIYNNIYCTTVLISFQRRKLSRASDHSLHTFSGWNMRIGRDFRVWKCIDIHGTTDADWEESVMGWNHWTLNSQIKTCVILYYMFNFKRRFRLMLSSNSEMDYCSNAMHKKIQSEKFLYGQIDLRLRSHWISRQKKPEDSTLLRFSGLPQVPSAKLLLQTWPLPGIRWECAAFFRSVLTWRKQPKWVGELQPLHLRGKQYSMFLVSSGELT